MKAATLIVLLLFTVTTSAGAECVGLDISLKERWLNLWTKLQQPGVASDPEKVYRRLTARYCEPHRAYHTLAHVAHSLDELDEVRELAKDPNAVEFALWFHDVVYDIGSANNEVESARFAQEAVQALGLAQEWANRVSDLILVTKHGTEPPEGDEQLVVDIDLSILGQPIERFDAYEDEIRIEYSSLIEERGLERFNAGRASILKRFLDRPAIYSTGYFRLKYEEPARANLRRSIEQLKKGTGT